jgi:hypothetical protein
MWPDFVPLATPCCGAKAIPSLHGHFEKAHRGRNESADEVIFLIVVAR